MRLIHYDREIITLDPDWLYNQYPRSDANFKPKGLWISDEHDYGWSHWCIESDFRWDDLKYEHLVELHLDNNILFLSTVAELDKFHEEFKARIVERGDLPEHWLNWNLVYPLWQGIIITPYLWKRRMDYMWYYSWDCASGCIWDLRAIRTFQPLLKQITWKE